MLKNESKKLSLFIFTDSIIKKLKSTDKGIIKINNSFFLFLGLHSNPLFFLFKKDK